MKAVNAKQEQNILNLQEGDLPWGNPKFYPADISSAIPMREWRLNQDVEEGLDPEVSDTRISIEGEILEGPWKFIMSGNGWKPTTREQFIYNWTSNPVDNPTIGDLVDKVGVYLRETADSHAFIDGFSANREERIIFVALGS